MRLDAHKAVRYLRMSLYQLLRPMEQGMVSLRGANKVDLNVDTSCDVKACTPNQNKGERPGYNDV